MDDRIILKIKQALAKSPLSEASYDVADARLVKKEMSSEETISLFETRAQFSGSKVHVIDRPASLKRIFKDIIPAGSSVMSALQETSVGTIGRVKDLIADDCQYFPDDALDTDQLFSVDVAVTDVTLAVAETGSVLIDSNHHAARMKSLVCTKHIALIRADQICSDLMDMSDYLSGLNPDELPGGFNLISGPSKTADIELQLVIGVHGPAELHLVVIKGP